MADEQDLNELLSLNEDELYLRLGRELAGSSAVPQSLGSLVTKGKQAFQELEGKIRPVVCAKDGPREGLGTLSNATLLPYIANAILSGNVVAVGHGAALYIAALILKHGLDKFCEGS